MSSSDVSIATAEEILKYAEEEVEKAIRVGNILLYRNAADKAFLSIVVAVNSYINRRLNIIPKSHSERRFLLRKIERKNLRAAYSDLMKTLHEEAFYEGIYNPEEVKYAINLARKILEEIKSLP